MGLGSGAFDQRVAIESRTNTPNAYGEAVPAWATQAETWARVEPLRGKEFLAAEQTQGAVDYRVTIRYRTGITANMRVVWRGVVLVVLAVIDVNARRENLELMCVSGQNDE